MAEEIAQISLSNIDDFMDACMNGMLELVQRGVEQLGFDINHIDQFDLSPLQRAIFCGQDYVALYLIEKGADVNRCNQERGSLLAFALHNVDVVKKLLARGMSKEAVNYVNIFGETAILRAVNFDEDFDDLLDLLVAHGADVNPTRAPIAQLCRDFANDRSAHIRKLLQFGAKVNVKDNEGLTPLAILLNQHLSTAEQPEPAFYESALALMESGARADLSTSLHHGTGFINLCSALRAYFNEAPNHQPCQGRDWPGMLLAAHNLVAFDFAAIEHKFLLRQQDGNVGPGHDAQILCDFVRRNYPLSLQKLCRIKMYHQLPDSWNERQAAYEELRKMLPETLVKFLQFFPN